MEQDSNKKMMPIRDTNILKSLRALPVSGYMEFGSTFSRESIRTICSKEKKNGNGVYKVRAMGLGKVSVERIQ